jgi:hypothetical protein
MISLFRRVYQEQDGQALYLVGALALFGVLLGVAALSIDIGYALHGQRELQASADAAAAAGALDLPGSSGNAATDATTAEGDATTAAGDNTPKDLYSVKVTTNVVKCWNPCPAGQTTNCVPNVSAVPPCNYFDASTNSTVDSNNVMIVQETAKSPTFFARVFGISSVNLQATAVAMEKGLAPLPINIFMVTDTTASMQDQDPPVCQRGQTQNCVPSGTIAKCSGMAAADWPFSVSTTKEDCAKWGIRTLLTGLNNNVQSVGLITFPPVNPSSDGAEYNCQSPTFSSGGNQCSEAGVVPYSCSASDFLILSLTNNYLNSSGNLATTSNLVGAVYWDGPKTCTTASYGLQDPGGEQTRYGEAISEATSVLHETPNIASAIIVLGDGSVNTGNLPCTGAISAAQQAAGGGVAVYSVAYGAPTNQYCAGDDTGYSYCKVMQEIASTYNTSQNSNFYSDDTAGCASTANGGLTDLGSIFKGLSERFGTTWMLPANLYNPGS